MNDHTIPNDHEGDVGDRNVARLLGQAYDPVDPDPQFAGDIQAKMLSAAEAAGPDERHALLDAPGPIVRETPSLWRRVPVRFWAAAMLLLAVNVAGLMWIHHDVTRLPEQSVRVLTALPTGPVDQTDRFSLTFDEPLASPDVVGTTPEAALFVIEPRPAGKWVWAARDRLEYLLDEQLPPGRVYNIRAADDVELRTGRTLIGESTFTFQTRALRLDAYRLATADRTHANVELTFNQPVDPAELTRHLAAIDSASRKGLKPVVLTTQVSPDMTLRCTVPPSRKLALTLDAKLAGHGGQLALGKAREVYLPIPEQFTITSTRVFRPSLNRLVEVDLRTSSEPDRKQKPPKITVSPAVENLSVRFFYQGLEIYGKFECGKRYTATVPGTLVSADGQTLGQAHTVSFDIPDRRPAVRFATHGGILTPKGNLGAELTAVNVSGLDLSAYRMHANNLVMHLRGTYPSRTGRQVAKKSVPLDITRNTPETMLVDLDGLLQGPRGIYKVTARAKGHHWTSSNTTVMVTDLGITTKTYRNGMEVWVTGLSTAKPVRGATVRAISHNNQVLAEAATDADGIARLTYSDSNPDGRPWLITAETDDDLSYLRPADHQWVIDDVDSGGKAHPRTYDVMLYTERGVYRPGDTMHLTGIIRDGRGRTPESFPVEIGVRRPDGKQILTLTVQPGDDGQGVFHADVPTGEDWQTGRYHFRASLPGSRQVLGSAGALVEAFVPVRMEVRATPSARRFGPADKREIDISARYLWDQPAAGLGVAVTGTFKSIPYTSRQYGDYVFRRAAKVRRVSIPQVRGTLDDSGRATIELALPKKSPPDLLAGTVSTSVTEPGGRSVSANAPVVIDTLDVHVGMRLPDGKVAPAGKDLTVDWVRVTGSDVPAAPTAMVFALSRIEHDCTLKIVNRRHVWKSVERAIPVTRRELAPSAGGTVSFKCPQPGRYRITMSGGERDPAAAVCEFHATDGQRGPETLPMNRPSRVEIVLDKPAYRPGETAKVLVRSPVSGTMLLTVEADRVIARRIVQLTEGVARLDLAVPADLRGGAFVTATVIRAIDPADEKWLPHRAMGMARLSTTHESKRLDLAVKAPAKARPGAKVAVTVRMPTPADPARPPMVHLWAVDEGILLTTAFKTPAPLEHFLAPRAAAVASADLFSRLMPDHRRPASMTRIGAGGDEDGLDALRRNPVPSRHRAPAVLWRTMAPAGADGTLTVELPLPQMTGELRLMAVAVDGDRYASAQAPLTVTAPLVVEIAAPRFAAPGDTFDVPVKFFNTTDKPMALATEVDPAGPIEIVTELAGITVAPGRAVTQWLKARAVSVGHVDLTVRATQTNAQGAPVKARSVAALPIRPASVPHVETLLRDFDAGATLAIQVPDRFARGTTRTRIEISPRPTIQLRPAIEKLIRYPYGCVEQTTSRLYGILYAPDLIALDTPDDARSARAADMVNAGIFRLWSMQTPSGGLAYWPGGRRADAWGTAYAAGFLLEARAAGYKIDTQFSAPLTRYLERLLDGDEEIDDNTRALICRTLAVFHRPQRGWMARLAERLDKLDIAGRAHLAAAYLAVGRRDRAWAMLPDDTLQQVVRTTTQGRLTNRARQEAVLLSVLLDLDAEHAWVARLARSLNAARQTGAWSSTLSNAAALAALARYETLMSADPAEFAGTVKAGEGKPQAFDHTGPAAFSFGPDVGAITLKAAGKGKVYVTATTEGLGRPDLVKPYDRGLTVRRRWLDRKGKPVEPGTLSVGDLVHVEISLARPVGAAEVHNIAVVDALPAGMEVENPRLVTSVRWQADGDDEPDVPDRIEFLDDRVVLFATARGDKQVFRYALRVTSAGRFALPAIQASCMYDPAVASMGETGQLEISR